MVSLADFLCPSTISKLRKRMVCPCFTQIASGFVQNGATVYISSRTESKLKETADKLNKLGKGKCIPIAGDLSEYDGCVKLAEEIGKREQRK